MEEKENEMGNEKKLIRCLKCGDYHENTKDCTNCKSSKSNMRSNIKVLLLSIVFVICLIGITIFIIVRIPFKYCGTYVMYSYYNGIETKYIYKISPLSIKYIEEYKEGNSLKRDKEYLKYYKKNGDIIIKKSYLEKYMIVEDDLLYLETSKDISFSKKYKDYYWNEKSKNSDLYEIESRAEDFEGMIETITNGWSRKLIYDTAEQQLGNTKFYIFNSEEESDKSDLNNYEVKFEVAGGDLTLYYDRKTKKLERIYFSGLVQDGLYGSSDGMKIEDFYDCRAMLLSIMYILANNNQEKLSEDISHLNTTEDLVRRTTATFDFDKLFQNKIISKEDEDRISYSLDNDRYYIRFENWLSISSYFVHGIINFSISVN